MRNLLKLFTVILLFSCSEDPVIYTLSATANPAEGGTVSPSSQQYDSDDVVTVTATPSAEYVFQSWSGSASGSSPSTTVTMDSDKEVVANFVKKKYALTINVEGEGSVAEKVIKAGFATDYDSGTVIELTAVQEGEWFFVEWTGDLTGSENPKEITIDKAKTVTAVFVKIQNPLVSAFFGLDNELPSLLCNQQGSLLDGMPVNFKFPIDASSLSETDFEVVDNLGNIHTPICVSLGPANDNGENRTVLLFGEFGSAVTNPPVEVRVVGDLFTTDTSSGESACSTIINLNGITTRNVIPLADGPSLFFAQKIDGNLNECNSGTQTIQVAWNGGVTPYISGDDESDLFQYYVGYSNSSGDLIPHVPISIADINDNDNFHQLCFSTSDEIVKISMMAYTVEDPNHDPNLYSEIDVPSCTN